MNIRKNIIVNIENLDEIKNRIPSEDFINEKYDSISESPLTDILFILSTPRSGSTFFSDLIYKNNICIPHEYFQPSQYIQIMGSRWNCINEKGVLNKEKYINNLVKYRTSNRGWLGINLHGEHLKIFSRLESILPKVNFHFIHIIRKNDLLQAISYEIASLTGKWSSNFDSFGDAIYSFTGIKSKLNRIHSQNTLIQAYLNSKNHGYTTIYYEDLVSNPEIFLKDILPDEFHDSLEIESGLKKQSSNINKEWLRKFSTEYFDTFGCGYFDNKSAWLKSRIVKNIKIYLDGFKK